MVFARGILLFSAHHHNGEAEFSRHDVNRNLLIQARVVCCANNQRSIARCCKMWVRLFLLLALMATAARSFSNCRCSLMTTVSTGMHMIYELPSIDMGSCNNQRECRERCTQEYNELTHNGDLYHMIDPFTSVGQFLCQEFKYDLNNKYVYPFYELCNGPWQYANSHSMQMLCCRNQQQYQCN